MPKFYRIQIGSIYLTSDGTLGGLPCKLSIENVEELQVAVSGNSQISASGARIRQIIDWQSGKEFSLKISTLKAEMYDQIKDFLNEKNENDSSFTVSGTGASGDFSVSARPALQKPFSCAGFNSYRVKDVVLRFET